MRRAMTCARRFRLAAVSASMSWRRRFACIACASRPGLRAAPGVEDRDFHAHPGIVRGAERIAGPGAAETEGRHRHALALRHFDARLRRLLLAQRRHRRGACRRLVAGSRRGGHVDRQRRQRPARLRTPAREAEKRGQRSGAVCDSCPRFFQPGPRAAQLDLDAGHVVAARHAARLPADDDLAQARELAGRRVEESGLLLRGKEIDETGGRVGDQAGAPGEYPRPRRVDAALGRGHPRRALAVHRHRQLDAEELLPAAVEEGAGRRRSGAGSCS